MKDFKSLTDHMLMAELKDLVTQERMTVGSMLMVLAEIERRKLHLEYGYSSLFVFLTKSLGFSEDMAQRRVQGARLANRFPLALALVREGKLHLAGLCLVGPHLTEENAEELLKEVTGKSKREIEMLVAGFKPAQVVHDSIKPIGVVTKLSEVQDERKALFPHSAESAGKNTENLFLATDTEPSVLALEKRVVFKFAASESLQQKFKRAQEVLWHSYPNGCYEDIFNAALDALLTAKDPAIKREKSLKRKEYTKRKNADGSVKSKPSSRYIPAMIKREVFERDEGRCTFVGAHGKRCAATAGLEFNHRTPWAFGGPSTADNLELTCRAHNQYLADEAHLSFAR